MATDISICSNALIRLGQTPISSFTEGENGNTCGTIYPDFVKSVLSSYPWRFTMDKVQLARLTAAPVNAYPYQFQLPSDLLILKAVYNSDSTGVNPIYNYSKQGSVILSHELELWIDYQKQVSESSFPAYFHEFIVTALSSVLAIAVTDQPELAQLYDQKAYGTVNDNRNGGLFGQAKKLDALQYPPEEVVPNDLIAARFS